ncbi:MAG: Asp-tRNA(Asn)/Glu-tRNA(Gln) amidotransferase subunit GatB [Bacilli bacterium]|jgi:aspartyl-tRNA(Asn)/glutamyl-tRNA(Gln) amidotransferase subunit B|nr:Asp-tRNA(Asn)/Glu-tRNA(Gln) amidotransferase subunit GatB [Bacilli bacterium]
MELTPTIGIEMHCEMKSHSKVFSTARNTYSEEANIHVAPVDIALPGILPVVNYECVKKAIKAAFILNCEVPKWMMFDRKNYYYPDLPKGYQITQNREPVGQNGKITIPFAEKELEVFIHDIHLEEDTAQLEHIGEVSYINYNRSGVPLLELVTEPCFHSKEEVVAFIEYIRRVYQYADISDADVAKGQIRCDVNISLSKTEELGVKVEVKGVSFLALADVIDYEIKRQMDLFAKGKEQEIIQETRRWDESQCETIHMRSKANAIDYKYFAEPNIPTIPISEEWKEEIRNEIPVMPLERLKRYMNDYGLSRVESNTLLKEKEISDYFETCLRIGIDAKIACNWITGSVLGYMNKEGIPITKVLLKPADLNFIIERIQDGTLSSKQAKEIVLQVLQTGKNPSEFITLDSAQISDETLLEAMCDEIILNNQAQKEAYLNGKSNLFEFFVGQVMKMSKGKANPVKTREILKKKLDEIC